MFGYVVERTWYYNKHSFNPTRRVRWSAEFWLLRCPISPRTPCRTCRRRWWLVLSPWGYRLQCAFVIYTCSSLSICFPNTTCPANDKHTFLFEFWQWFRVFSCLKPNPISGFYSATILRCTRLLKTFTRKALERQNCCCKYLKICGKDDKWLVAVTIMNVADSMLGCPKSRGCCIRSYVFLERTVHWLTLLLIKKKWVIM